MGLWLSGPANYVSVQFFILVKPHADFKQACQSWADRGVPFRQLMTFIHLPQLPTAFIDNLMADRQALERLTPSVWWLCAMYAGLAIYYFIIVGTNFALTGVLPYGIMRDCGSSVYKWTRLVVMQIGVLLFLFFPTYGAALWLPAFW